MFRRCFCTLNIANDKKAFLELVRNLRFKTEAPLTDCTAALKESNGDMDKAVEILRKKGAARAVKKGDRITEHGFVVSCVSPNPSNGAAIVTVCSETDFAARNEHFQKVCANVRGRFLDMMEGTKGKVLSNAEEATKILGEQSAKDLEAAIAVMGENIRVRSVTPLVVAPHVSENIVFGSYTHGTVGDPNVGRIVGLVALSPLTTEEVPASVKTAVARHFVSNSGAEGNYTHQEFFGSDNETVGKWLKRNNLKFSSSLVMEFGKEPVIHTAPVPHPQKN